MRFLFFTDVHGRGTSPQNRRDNFPETLAAKLAEVSRLAREEQVDYILVGGDLFDTPGPALPVGVAVLAPLQDIGRPIFAIGGNHDMFGHNPETLPRSMLGLAAGLGLIQLLSPGQKIYLEEDGLRVQLTGQPFHYNIDRRPPAQDYCVTKEEADFAIHLVHGMLLDRPVPGPAFTLVEDILATAADVTLVGHNHIGFPPVEHKGKFFICPGALVRLSNHPEEISRIPRVVRLDMEKNHFSCRLLPLSVARPGPEVLDRQAVTARVYREQRLASFVQGIRAGGEYRELRLEAMVEQMATAKGIDDAVRAEALKRLDAAREILEDA